MKNNEYMKVAVEEANINMKENFVNGGPFGAVIVKDGKIIFIYTHIFWYRLIFFIIRVLY